MAFLQTRRAKWTLGIIVVGALLAGGIAWGLLAPKGTRQLDEALPGEAAKYETVGAGEWRGADGFHHASGRTLVLTDGEATLLRFEGYDARDGPSVKFYLVRSVDDTSVEAVESEGILLGDADARGTFHLAIPPGVDVAGYGAVVAWCERFDTLFGAAPIEHAM